MNKILIVDDLMLFRAPIDATLRLAGYETLTAQNGAEALDLARQHQPSLVLLDLNMPVMDGMTFLKELRHDPSLAQTPVILLTAAGEPDQGAAASQLGVSGYLQKNEFTAEELLRAVAWCTGEDSEANRARIYLSRMMNNNELAKLMGISRKKSA